MLLNTLRKAFRSIGIRLISLTSSVSLDIRIVYLEVRNWVKVLVKGGLTTSA